MPPKITTIQLFNLGESKEPPSTSKGAASKMKYRFFNPELRRQTIPMGDAYDDAKQGEAREEWAMDARELEKYPYLFHVKELASSGWPHLKFLADFMEHGTAPTPGRWSAKSTDKEENKRRVKDRIARAKATNVCQIEYTATSKSEHRYTDADHLRKALDAESLLGDKSVKLRLFVVEDLSRDVIEALGSSLDIDPSFFREHIVDYAWYNVRDPWRDPPNLDIVARDKHWASLRFVRARYFETPDDFQEAYTQTKAFNVARRPDDDENNKAFWDKKEAKIGITRSKASLWMKEPTPGATDETAIAVVLVDPTIKVGYPLWRGYRNWAPTPSFSESTRSAPRPATENGQSSTSTSSTPSDCGPGQESFFEDFIYWAQKPEAFKHTAVKTCKNASRSIHLPAQALLHLICAEWITLGDYIKTRLNQIDWEIAYPEHFLFIGNNGIDVALGKLHMWRKQVPLYREMLSETFLRVFHTPILTGISQQALQCPPSPDASVDPGKKVDPLRQCHCFVHDAISNHEGSINAYRKDFGLALSYMEEHQQRIDRLTAVVTAAIGIQDSRRGYSDNKYLGRLTLLATVFIPMSFVATLFSMADDVSQLGESFELWAKVSLPASFSLVMLLSLPTFPSIWKKWMGPMVRPYRKYLKNFPGKRKEE